MTHMSPTTKRWLGGGLVGVFVLGLVSIGLFGLNTPVYAVDTESISAVAEAAAGSGEGGCLTAGATPAVCPQTGIKESLRTVSGKIISPAFRIALIQALLNLSQFVLNRLAYEAAVAIASGGPGEDSLFYQQTPAEAFAQLGLEVAGEAVGILSELSAEEIGIEFNLCAPTNPLLNLALAIGIKQKYQPTAPKCDILEVGKNWEGFFTNISQTFTEPGKVQDAILSKFAESLSPGKNELTATLRLNIAIDQKIHEQKLLQFLQQNEREYKPVQDFITGNVKTPSETLQGDFESKLKEVNGDQSKIQVGQLVNAGELIGGLALSTASTFTNVLLSQLLNRIYTGLFESEPLPDPFDLEAVAGGDKKSAQERFASIITTNPISTSNYNALSEFIVCTAQGVTNRGLNNCVMDVNFLAAVSRGNSGAAVTVQEAIDEGLLNGDWPLIPPDNEPANQDPFCYTYGYCYGNLVKLRNARVLPIGWELAALRNSESSPASLQEIIDGFNDCTQDGTIGPAGASDSDTKWCHLIDPNWVLKYPETQCRALGIGEIRLSTLSPGRTSVCVDAPSCIGEDNDGNCSDGFGYCVQEKNVWRFRGDECPEEYATCLSFQNSETDDQADLLVNTVDYSVCDADNAGCRWYRTDKYYEDAGTADDTSDDSYEWLPDSETYTTAEHDDDWRYQNSSGEAASAGSYSYTSDSGETYEYERFAYEDRLYLTHGATQCDDQDAGCTQLYGFSDSLYLNSVQNPSFEDDEDSDDVPDGWVNLSGSATLDSSVSQFGSTSVLLTPSTTMHLEQFIDVADNNFYTFSAYFQAVSDGATGVVRLLMLDENGDQVDAAGTSSDGDCEWNTSNQWYQMRPEPSADEFERTECLFTVVEDVTQVRMLIGVPRASSDDVYVDGVQLELGEDANAFTQGYSKTVTAQYYKIAPSYLGCSGSDTDPEACDDYAQMCSAQDVGCSLYTPEDGDPNVPAIISELDECPSECVGYTTYKQEATDYESEDFPLYFIADKASSCSEQYVGCDSYTNLDSLEEGGEQIEYYTDLRYCLSEDIADSSSDENTPATYFTWEGSDNAGYQLKTWFLLESNYSGSRDFFEESGFTETSPGLAPCINTVMTGPDAVACRDGNVLVKAEVWENADCDEHDDIFENPDCREFFDSEGNIHYRQYSDTISISDACTPYRKDEGNEDDCDDSGGYWTDQGFCRYYVLQEESTDCPAEQNGCRQYTGGAGRNATTILNETFESGTYEDFVIADIPNYPDALNISNESVATEGHSLYILAPTTGVAGVETVQISNSTTYDEDSTSTCDGTVGDYGCELGNDIDGDSSYDEECVVSDGDDSCGTLTNSLVSGKTFVLEFWAKGNADLQVTFEEEGGSGEIHDFVDPQATISSFLDLTSIELDGAWKLYNLGPLDTSDYSAFDETTILRFVVSAGDEAYLDNIKLKQVEENITLIKDSWVVPSTCDTTPSGAESDQYYLGCEAYTNQKGNDVDLYQFSDLCSEEVVGCEGFFHTLNSESVYKEIYNARCVYSTDSDLTDDETVSSNTTCEVDDIEYCTISTGRSYCTFDVEGVFESPLPFEDSGEDTDDGDDIYFGIVYGPETVVVSGDTPVYIVADDAFACDEGVMGCMELGEPTYSQDQSEVESFESVYYINLPSDYDNILCEAEALFCEEWASTKDGNFYFKDPLDKTCEYKTSVTIENKSYFGWFRTDTSEPCYWEDTDDSGDYDPDEDEEYLIAGEEFGVWRNGDEDDGDDDSWDYYDGWVASCDSKYDLCTEFIDVVDTGGGNSGDGVSYYFTNDELLDEEVLTDNQRCNGLVSQKFGCALFNNTTISELSYNAGATYVTSVHADVFYGEEKNSLVDPISCSTDEGGVFTISESNAAIAESDEEVDVCTRRCEYTVDSGDSLTTSSSTQGESDTVFYERSCLMSSDCPTLTTYLGEDVNGTCADVDDTYILADDSNEVLKVNRDRSCSAWLACESSRTSWNTSSNKYDTICDSINLCVEGSQQGGTTHCTQWKETSSVVLSDYLYSTRDVNWTGYEYSGLAIPNQLPVEYYSQTDLNPSKVCVDENDTAISNDNDYPLACSDATECGVDTDTECEQDSECSSSGLCDEESGSCYNNCTNDFGSDYRLIYNAGPCDSSQDSGVGNGGSCVVGFCESSPTDLCSSDDDCSDADCLVGYCQATGDTDCINENCSCNPNNNESDGTNSDCTGVTAGSGSSSVNTPVCDPVQFVCVNVQTSDEDSREACVDVNDCGTTGTRSSFDCVQTSSTTVGLCFNNSCLTDIIDADGDRLADTIDSSQVRGKSCRAYPEVTSPFPYKVVKNWIEIGQDVDGDDIPDDISSNLIGQDEVHAWSRPYDYVNGYQDAVVCSPTGEGEVTNDCLCSYDKVTYGNGEQFQFYQIESVQGAPIMVGVCASGDKKGFACVEDAQCESSSSALGGTCLKSTRTDSLYGASGYCIEKDSSIQLYGSSNTKDQACISWLPIDQLAGDTDLYGKYTEAGFPIKDTYYCAETAYFYDLYPLGAMLDDEGSVIDIDYACSVSEYSTPNKCNVGDYGPSDDCLNNVWCPSGYVALVGYCDNSDETSSVTDGEGFCGRTLGIEGDTSPAFDDCPYTCISEDSVHMEGEDAGESCLDTLQDLYGSADRDGGTSDPDAWKIGSLYENPGNDLYDSNLTDTTIFQDCVVRGVSGNYDFISQLILSGSGEVGQTEGKLFYGNSRSGHGSYAVPSRPINGSVGSCSGSGPKKYEACRVDKDCLAVGAGSSAPCTTLGPFDSGWFVPYLGCYEIVQASTSDLSVGNKAWTNRLWKEYNDSDPYKTSSSFYDTYDSSNYEFEYSVLSEPTRAGRALFEEYFERISSSSSYWTTKEWGDIAGWPLPILSCKQDSAAPFTVGLSVAPTDLISESGFCSGGQYSYPGSAQYESPTSASSDSILFSNHDSSALALSYEDIDKDEEYDQSIDSDQDYGTSTSNDSTVADADQLSVVELLSQLFAKVYKKWVWNPDAYEDSSNIGSGAYELVTETYGFDVSSGSDETTGVSIDEDGSFSANEFPDEDERAPVVVSIGSCVNTQCYEDNEGAMSVNGNDDKNVSGEAQVTVGLNFYLYAAPNQLPLRKIISDWGDAYTFNSNGSPDWPTDSQSGSTADNNFYKNHRGLNSSNGHEICDEEDEWGTTTDSCSASYISFSHAYTCTQGMLNSLVEKERECVLNDDGQLIVSPCTGSANGDISGGEGSCVYQPRVHAVDNWGWCTGFCDSNPDGGDDTDACYGDECNFEACPSGGYAGYACVEQDFPGTTSDPWVYFDGYVIVTP
jgi:hypothetical protein